VNKGLGGDARCFKGFKSSAEFERLFRRLEALERWRELAVRPSPEGCEEEFDNCEELAARRCDHVRTLMNDNLPPTQEALNDELVAKTSALKNARLGLFHEPGCQKMSLFPQGPSCVVMLVTFTISNQLESFSF
jgi:hypothetical protein